ncbi:MAG: hypothetical protein Q7U06_01975 [Pseudomonadota bacterium]|nr:hypothetical protein [Pseudomonadota bacterium]
MRGTAGKIRGGNILISAHATTSEEENAAQEIFERAGATDIKVGSEKAAPKDDTDRAPYRNV